MAESVGATPDNLAVFESPVDLDGVLLLICD